MALYELSYHDAYVLVGALYAYEERLRTYRESLSKTTYVDREIADAKRLRELFLDGPPTN